MMMIIILANINYYFFDLLTTILLYLVSLYINLSFLSSILLLSSILKITINVPIIVILIFSRKTILLVTKVVELSKILKKYDYLMMLIII